MSACESGFQTIDGVVVVQIHSELGLRDVDGLSKLLTKVCAGHPSAVALDLSAVHVLSSLAMGTIVEFRRGVQAHGGSVVLVGPHDQVRDALCRARLDQLFRIRGGPGRDRCVRGEYPSARSHSEVRRSGPGVARRHAGPPPGKIQHGAGGCTGGAVPAVGGKNGAGSISITSGMVLTPRGMAFQLAFFAASRIAMMSSGGTSF